MSSRQGKFVMAFSDEGDFERALITVLQIKVLGSPYALSGFINGKSVSIVRDNPADKAHL